MVRALFSRTSIHMISSVTQGSISTTANYASQPIRRMITQKETFSFTPYTQSPTQGPSLLSRTIVWKS